MQRSKSSQRWLKEHFNDEFVKRSKAEGWRSRAVYKLEEIDQKDHLIRPGMTLVDLGAAPGGWSQYATSHMQGKGRIVAMDILPMDNLPNVDFILGDFREDHVLASLQEALENTRVDLVMSDIAPNTSGIRAVDQSRSMYLVELAADFAAQQLKSGGCFLVKVFQGEGFDTLLKNLRSQYQEVVTRKPKASRNRSVELYLLGKGFRG